MPKIAAEKRMRVVVWAAVALLLAVIAFLSFNAYADVESAYICRGYVWDTRPYSAQYAGVNADLAPFGIVEPSVWTYSAMSPDGHSAAMRRLITAAGMLAPQVNAMR